MTDSVLRNNRALAGQGLALIRIIVGLWFAKALFTKLTLLGGLLPLPFASDRWVETMPRIIAKQMAENPITAYKAFVEGTVLTNPALFANLTALGEAVAGTLLVLGLFNGVGVFVALLLTLSYGMASWHMSPANQGFHWTLVAVMLGLWWGRAGMTWGIDARLAESRPGWWGSKRPWS
jgi:uncharacterized membrane protein YphA (DoxX/SURF4 family)